MVINDKPPTIMPGSLKLPRDKVNRAQDNRHRRRTVILDNTGSDPSITGT